MEGVRMRIFDALLADYLDNIVAVSAGFMMCAFGVSALIWALTKWYA